MISLAYTLSGLVFFMCSLFLIRQKVSIGFLALLPKLSAMALSPYWAIIGALGAILGWIYQALWAIPMGMIGAIIMTLYAWRCTREHHGFERAFGPDWAGQIPDEQASLMMKKRWSWFLKMKTSPEPLWERDVPFWTIPETNRQLLCDIWRPSDEKGSGLAFVYLHGSGWAIGDKDFGTRPLFRHLVSQGHTVMDVAYRLMPEVNIYGMVADAKRAVAWIKTNAKRYGIDPKKVVLGGASAGAHIALLSGYTPDHPELTPKDLKKDDLSVCGLVSYYGPVDLLDGYKRYKLKRQPPVPIGTMIDRTKMQEAVKYAGRFDILLGGHPEEVPDMYQLACPTTHVHSNTPPTLLMQGNKDFLVPMKGTRELYAKLLENDVPAVNVVLPWTDHAFDILLPQFSPPAQSALYDLDRFLALLVNRAIVK